MEEAREDRFFGFVLYARYYFAGAIINAGSSGKGARVKSARARASACAYQAHFRSISTKVLRLPSRRVALAVRQVAGRRRWLVSLFAALSRQLVPVRVQWLWPLSYVYALPPLAGVAPRASRFTGRRGCLRGCLARCLATLARLTQTRLLRGWRDDHLVRLYPALCKSFSLVIARSSIARRSSARARVR